MKLSDIAKGVALRADFKTLRALQDSTNGFPRSEGELVIDGRRLPLTPNAVDQLLSDHEEDLLLHAAALGLEVDE